MTTEMKQKYPPLAVKIAQDAAGQIEEMILQNWPFILDTMDRTEKDGLTLAIRIILEDVSQRGAAIKTHLSFATKTTDERETVVDMAQEEMGFSENEQEE